MNLLTRFFLATFVAALSLGGRAEAQTTSTWANSNVAGTPASPLDWFTGGPNTQGTWTGGTPASNSATTIQFFENTTTALTNTATPSSQTVNLNNGGSAFQLGTLTLSGLASATANANLTMTLSGDALNFSGATGTINLNALNNLSSGTRTITYNVNNNIQLGTASSASALTIGGAGTGSFVLDGIISELKAGGGSLTKSGASTVSFAGANTYTGATTVTGGVLLLNNANALPGGIGATGGTSNLTLNGGVVGLTSNFSRGIGTSASQVQWASNGGGFAAYGADRTVNLGGNATPSTITWGNTAANGGFSNGTLILGAADATHTVELVNGLNLGSGARQINVNNGAATFDAKLSGAIVGTGGLQLGNYQAGGSILLTGSNSYSGGTAIALVNGVVAISNANALGTGTVSMRQQMTLASTSPTPLTLNNGISYDNRDLRFTAKLGSADATGNLTLAGGLNFVQGGSWTSGNSNAAFVELVGLSSVDITGQISGTYVNPTNAEVGFQVKAGQTLRLGADNSAWTQNVVLAYPGTTVIGHAKALGSGTFLRFGTFDLGVGSAAGNSVVVSEVDLTGANALTQTVTIERVGSGSDYTAGGFAGTRSIELAGGVGFFTQGKSFANNISGGSLLISGDVRGTGVGATTEAYFVGTGNTTITGNIRNGDAATLNFRSENTGITTLSGSNTYNGTTAVNAGILVFSGTQAKAAGTVTAAAAGSIGLGVGGDNSYTSANVAALFGNTLTGFSMNAASGVAVDTTGGNFTVSDALAGTRAFTKLGPNTLTLSGNNTFSGAFTVSDGGISIATINNASANGPLGNRAGAVLLGSSGKTGTLEYTGATASSTKPFTAVAGGTAAFSVTDAAAVLTLSGLIDGAGGLTKAGAGRLVLTNVNTFSGNTTVNAGTLVVNGSLAAGSAVSVGANGTLGGTGTINGATTILGAHTPGNSPGIQTFASDLTYSGGSSTVQWELIGNTITNAANPNAVYDQILVGGNLDFAGATSLSLLFNGAGSSVLWADAFWDGPQQWTLYDVTGSTTGFGNLSLASGSYLDSGSNSLASARPNASFSVVQLGNDVVISYVAVPEPSGIALAGLGLAAAAFASRRRRC